MSDKPSNKGGKRTHINTGTINASNNSTVVVGDNYSTTHNTYPIRKNDVVEQKYKVLGIGSDWTTKKIKRLKFYIIIVAAILAPILSYFAGSEVQTYIFNVDISASMNPDNVFYDILVGGIYFLVFGAIAIIFGAIFVIAIWPFFWKRHTTLSQMKVVFINKYKAMRANAKSQISVISPLINCPVCGGKMYFCQQEDTYIGLICEENPRHQADFDHTKLDKL